MKQWIIDHFSDSAEANVVNKHFGSELGDDVSGILNGIALDGKEDQLLAKARELEEEKKSE